MVKKSEKPSVEQDATAVEPEASAMTTLVIPRKTLMEKIEKVGQDGVRAEYLPMMVNGQTWELQIGKVLEVPTYVATLVAEYLGTIAK